MGQANSGLGSFLKSLFLSRRQAVFFFEGLALVVSLIQRSSLPTN